MGDEHESLELTPQIKFDDHQRPYSTLKKSITSTEQVASKKRGTLDFDEDNNLLEDDHFRSIDQLSPTVGQKK